MTFDVVSHGAAVPVPSRGTMSQFLDIHGHTFLIDAGEGVQLALRNNKRRFQKLKGILSATCTATMCSGCPALMTMSLLGRQEAIDIWVLQNWTRGCVTWGSIQAHMSFEVKVHEWSPHESKPFTKRAIIAAQHSCRHRILAVACVWKNIPCRGN